MDRLGLDIFDSLVDGPSSFATTYGDLVRNYAYPEQSGFVDALLARVEQLEMAGLIQTRCLNSDGSLRKVQPTDWGMYREEYVKLLPRLEGGDPHQFAWDEIGLQMEITGKGRAEWDEWASQARP